MHTTCSLKSPKCQSHPTSLLLSCLIFVYTGDVTGTFCHDVISYVMKINEQAMDLPNYSVVSGWLSYFVLFAVKNTYISVYTSIPVCASISSDILLYRTLLLLWDMYPIYNRLVEKNAHGLCADSHSGFRACVYIYSQDSAYAREPTVRTKQVSSETRNVLGGHL